MPAYPRLVFGQCPSSSQCVVDAGDKDLGNNARVAAPAQCQSHTFTRLVMSPQLLLRRAYEKGEAVSIGVA